MGTTQKTAEPRVPVSGTGSPMARQPTGPDQLGVADLPGELGWLRDAPMFIDRQAIEGIYDAIVRPTYHDGTVTLTASEAQKSALERKMGVSFKAMLAPFLPFNAEAGAAGEIKKSTEKTDTTGGQITFHPISTPQRQLEQLCVFYLLGAPERLEFVRTLATGNWLDPKWISKTPRGIAFVDLPPGIPLIPTAAEFTNNKVITLFDQLLAKSGERPPVYPEARFDEDRGSDRKDYWDWFRTNFSATRAMAIIEQAASENGRIRWIDYRLCVDGAGGTVHLHVCPQGDYDTGVFAYNFVKRGMKHGLRLVGTMKQEPDMNILAIFEK
ncbi:hypothetical protein RZS28_11075 [Methylocapsa polymorpha]|uniref:Uncharacterized protein n=1 Tax=Methylocapsa polymorpha TaxID=3080828 RepID=A0ABZ0HR24_9HYPH|nr:hypothetical protein RZS28_11075 [Methylocapsa sp. RX1]